MADRRFTDLELERSLAGDLSPARTTALSAEATPADRARLAELEAEHAAFLGSVDVELEVRRIEQRAARYAPEPRQRWRSWLRWLAPVGTLAAAAAVLVFFLGKKAAPERLGDDDLRTKGDDISLVIHGEDHQLSTGDTVTPGTKIRFEVQGGKQGFIAIVGIDGSHMTTVYYPYGAHDATAIGLDNRLLPSAIQLDATPGDETFYALFSLRPFALDPVVPALNGETALPAGIVMSRVVLHKK